MKAGTAIVLGAAAWAGYEFWYKPARARELMEEELRRQALEEQAKHGGGFFDAAKKIGKAGCMAVGKFYKVPEKNADPICSVVAAIGDISTRKSLQAAKFLGKEAGKGAKDVGRGIKSVAHKLHLAGLDDWLSAA